MRMLYLTSHPIRALLAQQIKLLQKVAQVMRFTLPKIRQELYDCTARRDQGQQEPRVFQSVAGLVRDADMQHLLTWLTIIILIIIFTFPRSSSSWLIS